VILVRLDRAATKLLALVSALGVMGAITVTTSGAAVAASSSGPRSQAVVELSSGWAVSVPGVHVEAVLSAVNVEIVDGSAEVALDPKFANVIDKNAGYLVSVTPEGDCRGLYVAHRSTHGFSVRELQGGHASVSFEYRIIAKEFGVNEPRLPMTTVPSAVSLAQRLRAARGGRS